jgi:hypothetical protein
MDPDMRIWLRTKAAVEYHLEWVKERSPHP